VTDGNRPPEPETLVTHDGQRLALYAWPADEPRALLQVLHGLSEHAERYDRFARLCAAEGFTVVAHNHRGHGRGEPAMVAGHFADDRGWERVLEDVHLVRMRALEDHGDLPCLLFGHSMGSYLAQAAVMREPDAWRALLLSGSTHAPRVSLWLGRLAAAVEAWRYGKRFPSDSLNRQAFGAFNRRFRPARTAFDWLSRDPDEVDRYVADPFCGGIPSAGLWQDLLRGMLEIGRRRNLLRIPERMPILVTGGSDDPVGGRRGMERLVARLEATGHEAVRLRVFENGRHEMLNETNREEFEKFVIEWMAGVLPDR